MPSDTMKPLFTQEQIAARIRDLGREISEVYGEDEILLVGVLKGSFLFLADLSRQITSPVIVDFVRLASYGSETRSSGIVEMRKDLEISVKGRDVLIVEDIVDSGLTLESLYHRLLMRQPNSLRVCTLIDKRSRREVDIEADFIGFSLDDGFIIGYGLDYDERFRNLADIYLVED